MAFESLTDFMTMCYVAPIGDTRCHGAYVWSAYGIAALVIIGNLVAIARQRRNIISQIQRKIRREQAGS